MAIEILTTFLVIITAFYAWATYKILRANEKVVEVMSEQAEAMSRPYVTVSVTLEADSPSFQLRISNKGKTPANNLKLTISESFHQFGNTERDISTFSAFNNTIEALHPGSEILFSLAQTFKVFSDNKEGLSISTVFTINAEYSYTGKTVIEDNIIDLRPFLNSNRPKDAYIERLKKINESLEVIGKNISNKP